MKKIMMFAAAAALMAAGGAPAHAEADGAKIFKKKCAMCHKVDRKKVGPAVKDMNTDPAVLKEVVMKGRKMMPAFGKKLDEAEIEAVVAYLRSQQQD
ncbi:MAG: cytochrome c [Mariprofundaceae bacterium]